MNNYVTQYRIQHPISHEQYHYPCSEVGIYINRKYSEGYDKRVTFKSNILMAEELYFYNNWAGYKEIFIKTEDEYIYFCE
ncbi:hypothetical protein J2T20_002625 [Paenibacillus wynnii]|nr:hypothetical protein [Paenibacillus wynnii]